MPGPLGGGRERVEVDDDELERGDRRARSAGARWSASRRSARMPPWIRGWSVLTRPSSISGKPVTAATSVTGRPASRSVRAVPPVETSSKPRPTRPRAEVDQAGLVGDREEGPARRRDRGIGPLEVDATRRPSGGDRQRAGERASATARGRSRCSTAWIRSWSVASSSPGRTGTASWATIGPPSSVSSTRWTVAPVTADAVRPARRGPRARRGTPAGATGGC